MQVFAVNRAHVGKKKKKGFESEISYETYSVHGNTGCFSSSKSWNLYFISACACMYCGPPTDSFWNLVIEMAATVLEGNHKKIAPDLKSVVTAGLASHLTLISLHLRGLLLGVKSTSYLTSAKSKRMTDGRTPTGTPHALFSPLPYLWLAASYLCCAAVAVAFPHPPSASSSFYVSSMHDGGVFFFCGRRHFGCWLLRSRPRTATKTRPARLDL